MTKTTVTAFIFHDNKLLLVLHKKLQRWMHIGGHVEENELFDEVFKKYSKSKSWVVLSSLCCHEQCPPKVLDPIVKMGFNKGYEYILKIISRNKNVTKETLKKIIENPNLEYRYRITAQIAHDKGVKKANELR